MLTLEKLDQRKCATFPSKRKRTPYQYSTSSGLGKRINLISKSEQMETLGSASLTLGLEME